MSEYRRDPFTGRWRIIAEGRSARPNDYAGPPAPKATDENCPFCEGHESRTPPETQAVREAGAPNGPGWTVRAIPNRFPSVAGDRPTGASGSPPPFEAAPGSGVHEVVIESPRHAPDLPYLEEDHLRVLFRLLRSRVRALAARPGSAAVLLFENRGPESGGTLPHPHAQVLATDLIPPRLEEERAAFRSGVGTPPARCRLEEVVANEAAAKTRLVVQDPLFTAFCPFASEFPFEVWIVPTRHSPEFGDATDAEVDGLAHLLPRILRALDVLRGRPSYNWFVHGLRGADAGAENFHWHLELAPRIVRADAFELGSGIPVNPVAPEAAADAYRRQLAAADGPGRRKE